MNTNKEELQNVPYTLALLKAESRNQLYDSEHYANEQDVLFCNLYQTLIQQSRRDWQPVAGDILVMKDGKRRHIDSVESYGSFKGGKSIQTVMMATCQNAYTPFIHAKINDSSVKISLSTSGGPWENVESESKKLQHLGTEEKFFTFFGHSGACGNGAVDFRARVNVWQLK